MKRFLFTALFAGVFALASVYGADQPKARLLNAPRPMKPPEAVRLRLGGSGVFMMEMDINTGKARSIKVVKSTGHQLLDHSAIQALQKWRFAPGAIRVVRVPITFSASEVGGRF